MGSTQCFLSKILQWRSAFELQYLAEEKDEAYSPASSFCSVNEAGGADHSAEVLTVSLCSNIASLMLGRSFPGGLTCHHVKCCAMCRMPAFSLRAKVILPLLNYRMLGWATQTHEVQVLGYVMSLIWTEGQFFLTYDWEDKKGVLHKVHKVWYIFVSFTYCIRSTFCCITSRKRE